MISKKIIGKHIFSGIYDIWSYFVVKYQLVHCTKDDIRGL